MYAKDICQFNTQRIIAFVQLEKFNMMKKLNFRTGFSTNQNFILIDQIRTSATK